MSLKSIIDPTSSVYTPYHISSNRINWEPRNKVKKEEVPTVVVYFKPDRINNSVKFKSGNDFIMWKNIHQVACINFYNFDPDIVEWIEEDSIDFYDACDIIQDIFLRRFKST